MATRFLASNASSGNTGYHILYFVWLAQPQFSIGPPVDLFVTGKYLPLLSLPSYHQSKFIFALCLQSRCEDCVVAKKPYEGPLCGISIINGLLMMVSFLLCSLVDISASYHWHLLLQPSLSLTNF
jgi:hypothetical protein